MKRIVLQNGRSYTYKEKTYKNGEPALVEDNIAKYLISTGYFRAITDLPQNDHIDPSQNDSEELTTQMIEGMKREELEALAAEKEIDIKDCKTNAEKAERIKGALGLVNFNHLDFGQ